MNSISVQCEEGDLKLSAARRNVGFYSRQPRRLSRAGRAPAACVGRAGAARRDRCAVRSAVIASGAASFILLSFNQAAGAAPRAPPRPSDAARPPNAAQFCRHPFFLVHMYVLII
ncbi:hypothetical protein EVAR_23823_1 [Eumeta japonica]|uniref:Uncharacterized protein n=1 Tax=Eumeta variegata TaxID=151549 RepID=A0A4C1VM48_EUMVA|nr:hypothetical protein EVAR_23823_1 [Eumeta japonica]